MLFKNASELIGNTPLVELTNIEKQYSLKAKLYAKVEYFNPTGSVKDRIALSMINDAFDKGLINENSVLIEPTSGNTGIGIAALCAMKNIKCILVMPESMSIERRKLLSIYGAKLVLTEAKEGMGGSIKKAKELEKTIPNAVILGQFDNEANPRIHYLTTGKEIYNDLNGKVDLFVAGIGTGGTISGTGKYLKEKIKGVKIIGVEPLSSPVISQNKKG
ncbi:MAG: cysteine synthase family protein, partial [Bacilli bacterium]|nr:cysteine synthase family protein [Bacilli bacterium]MDY5832519.1 cysteine synthase family protein [Candidatus Onthovivens sp.]